MRKTKAVIISLSVLCCLSLAAMVFALTQRGTSFTPPSFDASAITGTPDVDDALGYCHVYQDGMAFSAHVCGNVTIESDTAIVYFTNDIENDVWLMLRVADTLGTSVFGESGIVRPGEYVRSIELDAVPESGSHIRLEIIAYEPETYYSAGRVALNTTVGAN